MSPAVYQKSMEQLREVEGGVMRELDVTDEQGEPLIALRVGADQQPDAQLERTEMRHLVSDALTCLPERERKILTLYYEKELTLKEISVVVGVCESRVVSAPSPCGVTDAHLPHLDPWRLTPHELHRLSLHFFSRRADRSGTVMSVPEPDSRVVPLERPFRTEREPVTCEPRRSARALCANIVETPSYPFISEQGGKDDSLCW